MKAFERLGLSKKDIHNLDAHRDAVLILTHGSDEARRNMRESGLTDCEVRAVAAAVRAADAMGSIPGDVMARRGRMVKHLMSAGGALRVKRERILNQPRVVGKAVMKVGELLLQE